MRDVPDFTSIEENLDQLTSTLSFSIYINFTLYLNTYSKKIYLENLICYNLK